MESLHTDPIVQSFYPYNNSIDNLSDEVYFDLGNNGVIYNRAAWSRCLDQSFVSALKHKK